jgi:hypothetical protein
LDRQRGADGAFGVVLLRPRIAKEGHQTIAEPLKHMPAEPRYRAGGLVQVRAHQVAPVLGVELRSQISRADEIAEHYRDRAAFSRDLGTTLGRCGL